MRIKTEFWVRVTSVLPKPDSTQVQKTAVSKNPDQLAEVSAKVSAEVSAEVSASFEEVSASFAEVSAVHSQKLPSVYYYLPSVYYGICVMY